MRRRLTAAAVALAAVAAGCGGSAGDVLAIAITGGPGGEHQTLVFTQDGRVSCNGGSLHEIANSDLLAALAVARDAKSYATHARVFPPGPLGGRRFVLRDADGSVAWSETSSGVPHVLPRAEELALRVGRSVC
jgi:hypothetical protein